VSRWWKRPHRGVLKLTPRLGELLPTDVVRSLDAAALHLEGYRWLEQGVQIVLIAVTWPGRHGATYGVAAAATPAAAALEALCRSLHTRVALYWPGYPGHPTGATAARLLTSWRQGPDHLAMLDRHATEGEDRAGGIESWSGDWVDVATRRFGHEPVMVTWTDDRIGEVTRILCPCAAVYQPVEQRLPCPVW